MDSALSHYHDKIKEELQSLSKIYQVQAQLVAWNTALLAFLDANLQAGIDVVLDETRFQERVKDAQIVITGKVKWMSKRFMVKHP